MGRGGETTPTGVKPTVYPTPGPTLAKTHFSLNYFFLREGLNQNMIQTSNATKALAHNTISYTKIHCDNVSS